MIIGIDDTDSRSGMCTTYLCTVLVDELESYGEVSTPVLVRLNPCIPFKSEK
jgi:tRNA(Ile2)-agmatinylcytidine synthase